MAEDGPPGPGAKRPGRASARLAARAELASEPSLLLRALTGDPLRAIAQLLPDAAQTCFRLVCTVFRDHSSKPKKKCIVDFLCTRALAVFAWECMPEFILADPSRMLCLAASIGNVGVLEELIDNWQCVLSSAACAAAAEKGHLDALAWLHSRGCPWDSDTCAAAAQGGHLEVLRYAHEHGCPWDSETCYCAAKEGHLELLRYAHEHGCPWDGDICFSAADEGCLEVLRYAHEHGCPWDGDICFSAGGGGHLEVLRYAHKHGYEWCEATCYCAAEQGHLEMLQYAHEHGSPWDSEPATVLLKKGTSRCCATPTGTAAR